MPIVGPMKEVVDSIRQEEDARLVKKVDEVLAVIGDEADTLKRLPRSCRKILDVADWDNCEVLAAAGKNFY